MDTTKLEDIVTLEDIYDGTRLTLLDAATAVFALADAAVRNVPADVLATHVEFALKTATRARRLASACRTANLPQYEAANKSAAGFIRAALRDANLCRPHGSDNNTPSATEGTVSDD